VRLADIVQAPQDAGIRAGDDDPDRPARRQDGFHGAVAGPQGGGLARDDGGGVGKKPREGVGHMAAGRFADARPGRGVMREDRAVTPAQHDRRGVVADHADRPVERLRGAAPGQRVAPRQEDGRTEAAAADRTEDEGRLRPREEERGKPREQPDTAQHHRLHARFQRPQRRHGRRIRAVDHRIRPSVPRAVDEPPDPAKPRTDQEPGQER
jgi:hypothetical protein